MNRRLLIFAVASILGVAGGLAVLSARCPCQGPPVVCGGGCTSCTAPTVVWEEMSINYYPKPDCSGFLVSTTAWHAAGGAVSACYQASCFDPQLVPDNSSRSCSWSGLGWAMSAAVDVSGTPLPAWALEVAGCGGSLCLVWPAQGSAGSYCPVRQKDTTVYSRSAALVQAACQQLGQYSPCVHYWRNVEVK